MKWPLLLLLLLIGCDYLTYKTLRVGANCKIGDTFYFDGRWYRVTHLGTPYRDLFVVRRDAKIEVMGDK